MLNFRASSRLLSVISGAALVLSLASALSWQRAAVAEEEMQVVPPPKVDEKIGSATSATAVFAGGCFWGVQGVFQHVKGVTSAISGYSGGAKATASYPAVSTGITGHAESVKITYDPSKVSYGKLLQIYFSVVTDPTTLNAQGPDEGPQYRSDIFALTPEQARIAKDYIEQLQTSHIFHARVVTQVTPYNAFYPAEAYHQNYLTNHPAEGYIAANDIPKVEGLKKLFPTSYRDAPVLTAAK